MDCNCHANGLIGCNPITIRVLMFPWLAHGHITPFLELAKKLTRNNFIVYLCSTPANLNPIKQKLNEKFSDSIHFVELRLPTSFDDVLPPHYHTTNGLPPHLMNTLKEALDMSCPTFTNILKALKPDLLIYDFLQPWAAKAALELDIPAVDLISSSATMTSLMYHVFMTDKGMEFPFSSSIYYRDYEMHHLIFMRKAAEKKEKNDMRALDSIEMSSNIVLIKSFKEIEGKYSDYLSYLSGKKFVPLGPLVQESDIQGDENSEIIKWLNKKEQGSTVFVSFGSEYFLSKVDREEIALGLEVSNANFVWVLRFPKGSGEVELEDALPEGFLKRVGDRGMVIEGWAPQAKILQHGSIGGFVSHCGWNSVIEGMKFGVPIIAMPMHLDQPINARLIEELGVGLEVVRDSDGKLQKETIAQVINQVVIDESGDNVRNNAKNMSEKIGIKGDEEIDEVVEQLTKLCKKKKY